MRYILSSGFRLRPSACGSIPRPLSAVQTPLPFSRRQHGAKLSPLFPSARPTAAVFPDLDSRESIAFSGGTFPFSPALEGSAGEAPPLYASLSAHMFVDRARNMQKLTLLPPMEDSFERMEEKSPQRRHLPSTLLLGIHRFIGGSSP